MIRLIDADELKNKINDIYDYLFLGCNSSDFITFAKGVNGLIDNAPTVELRDNYDIGYAEGHIDGVLQGEKLYARPTGEWIDDFRSDYEPFMQRGWKCTNCSKRTTYGKPAFCMYCGADMRGKEE